MKKQNFLAALLLATSMILGTFVHAQSTGWETNIVPVEEMYEKVSCVSGTNKVYLNQDNDADTLRDFARYLNSNFMLQCNATYGSEAYAAGQIVREVSGTPYTNVKYYTPSFNMLYKISTGGQIGMIDDNTFWRASWVFPCNTPVRGIASTPNKIVFEQPSNTTPENNTISILYDYRYVFSEDWNGTTTSPYRYNKIASMNYMGNINVEPISLLPGTYGNRKRKWSPVKTLTGCQNFELSRCGNGKIDTPDNSYVQLFTGEVCDDGPLNGTPGYCDITCGNGGGAIPRCGDNIIQELGSTPYDSNNDGIDDGESWEECDDGDDPNDLLADGDGAINTETIGEGGFCSNICLYHFVEAFVEVFINE